MSCNIDSTGADQFVSLLCPHSTGTCKHPSCSSSVVIAVTTNYRGITVSRDGDGLALMYSTDSTDADQFVSLLNKLRVG